ncbi:MAG: nucleoside deaminase [Deltaproteobacteria bacterium]|nr:MAG: nucleoside deaminase [Deltaproteobacteria bacterium]
MNLAIDKAREGMKKGQMPFGACIVKNNKVVVSAHNVVWKDTDITAHGEVNAIRKACKKLKTVNLKGCVIYSTCEPCPMCFTACHWSKISKIYYGVSLADAKKVGFIELDISNQKMRVLGRSHMKLKGGLREVECQELFDEFSKLKNKRTY